jgi:DinB family
MKVRLRVALHNLLRPRARETLVPYRASKTFQRAHRMKIIQLLLAELDHEAVGIRKVLENVPEGKNDWKPHEKSMALGYLATLVANIFSWLDMVVNVDEIDINPPGGSKFKLPDWKTRHDLLEQFEASLKKGREVLQKTTDDHLLSTKWRMLSAGKLMMEQSRYEGIREGVLNHMAHHRGQLTVYLRLNGEKVPAIYGPSADEGK